MLRENRQGISHPSCDSTGFVAIGGILGQFIFTVEIAVKLVAEGYHPKRFFKDGWNCLDFFVVITGFVELTPGDVFLAYFPVISLRLLRLLRVFRLAKAFPRLRSIVQALILSFSSVGWILILILVFNCEKVMVFKVLFILFFKIFLL